MKLEDLKPKPSKFYLSKTQKEYTLRPWCLQDQIWMNQEYGEKVNEIFSEENIDIVAITRMAYRLLVDKSDFKAQKVKDINEDGEEVETSVGGYKLLINSVNDLGEQIAMLSAVMECIGLSMPQIDELKKTEISLDKTEKKTQPTKQTGARL